MMLGKVERKVIKLLDGRDSADDFQHIKRVYKNAEVIGRREGADMKILLLAALLHDLVVYPKGSAKTSKSADDSADMAEKLLKSYRYPQDKIDKISYCIRTHSYSKRLVPATLEAKILQDADRLDALGAIGIARTFSVGGSGKRPFYNKSDPFCQKRKPDDTKWTLDHFYKKLLRLEKKMNTKTAKKEARRRTKLMKKFLDDFKKEI